MSNNLEMESFETEQNVGTPMWKLGVFFFFNVLLPTVDVGTDLSTATTHFTNGNSFWAACTLIPIFAPCFVRCSIGLVQASKSASQKNKILFSVQCSRFISDFVWNFPGVQSIRNLRKLFALKLMDSSLHQNFALMNEIKFEVMKSGILEAFLESAPQLILQFYIIFTSGIISLPQYIGLPVGFLSLSYAATGMFFSQRLGIFPDPDPSILRRLFIFPFVMAQTLGPLFALVLLAMYFKGYLFLGVAIVFINVYLAVTIFAFRCRPLEETFRNLYKRCSDDEQTKNDLENLRSEVQRIFYTAVFASWISTVTVWTNNFRFKSKFLFVSSVASELTYAMFVGFIYILLHTDIYLNIEDYPLIHCFPEQELSKVKNSSSFTRINISMFLTDIPAVSFCPSKLLCEKVVRLCNAEENPTDLFTLFLGPIALSLLVLSLLASLCLQHIGSYYQFHKWTETLTCKLVKDHHLLFHDYLVSMDILETSLKDELHRLFEDTVGSSNCDEIIYQRDSLFGLSCVDCALYNHRDKELEMMARNKNGFLLDARWGKIKFSDLKFLHQNQELIDFFGSLFIGENPLSENTQELFGDGQDSILQSENYQTFSRITLERAQAAQTEIISLKESPLHEACENNNGKMLFFLTMLGGDWSSKDSRKVDVMQCLLDCMYEGKFDFEDQPHYIKSMILNIRKSDGFSIFHFASHLGHKNALSALLKEGVNVNERHAISGDTALYLASFHNRQDCLQLLLDHGAKVNSVDSLKNTPLHAAATRGNISCAKILIQNGANVNAKNNFEFFTPLHIATRLETSKMANLLIQSGASVNEKDRLGMTPLHFASSAGKYELVKILVDSKANINTTTKDGTTPLMCGIFSGNHLVVNTLLSNGSCVNSKNDLGLTALHFAISKGDPTLALMLIQKGAEIEAHDFADGVNALHLAACEGKSDCIRILLEHGADVNALCYDKRSALQLATEAGNCESMALLLASGSHVDHSNGATSLHMAVDQGRAACVKILLEHGADVNKVIENGQSALHLASEADHFECLKLMLELHGCELPLITLQENCNLNHNVIETDPLIATNNKSSKINGKCEKCPKVNLRDNKGNTPLHEASLNRFADSLEILIQHGADPNAKTKKGHTPIHLLRSSSKITSNGNKENCHRILTEAGHNLKDTLNK